jgi:hypothetical protein
MPLNLKEVKPGDVLINDHVPLTLYVKAVDEQGVYAYSSDGTKAHWVNIEDKFSIEKQTQSIPLYYHIYLPTGSPFIRHSVSALEWNLFKLGHPVQRLVFSTKIQGAYIDVPVEFNIAAIEVNDENFK